jgi:deazaflavin-dependent oxidoreductase (nitroreductase family)
MPEKISNFFVSALIRSPLHIVLGDNFAVVTVQGRKTGRFYSTPVNVYREGDAFIVVSLRSRTWWRNLRGGHEARLRVSGKDIHVIGEVVNQQDEVVEGLVRYFDQYPKNARYFDVKLKSDGRPNPEDVRRIAGERLLVRLTPI